MQPASRIRNVHLGGRSGEKGNVGRSGVRRAPDRPGASRGMTTPHVRRRDRKIAVGRMTGGRVARPRPSGTNRGEQGERTPGACADETGRRVRGGENRQGRAKRRRRTEAGVEPRDEVLCQACGESRTSNAAPGSGFLGLGASEGRETSGERVSSWMTAFACRSQGERRRHGRGPRGRV
jgi:hypothetical protein